MAAYIIHICQRPQAKLKISMPMAFSRDAIKQRMTAHLAADYLNFINQPEITLCFAGYV